MSADAGNSPADLEKLLAYLKASRGFDFSAYKRTTLQRRIRKRMEAVSIAKYVDYVDYLEVHQAEFKNLFNTILINVTSFFRDPEAWDYLRAAIVPALAQKAEDSQLRIWVAGCASGEEAYSLAMFFAEEMGREKLRERVKIYATDLDEDALNSSRNAVFTERDVQVVPNQMLNNYFEQSGDKYVFDRDLRRSVIFGRHDLILDAPISKVDLLSCRNTLMYFNAEAQERILARFNFALTEGGYLFLGRAETLLTHTNLFAPLDMKNRVFSKVSRGRLRDRALLFGFSGGDGAKFEINGNGRLRDAALEGSPLAHILVDGVGKMVWANERARSLFSIGFRDVGRYFQDLEVSYRPVELRSGMDQAAMQRRIIHHKDVNWTTALGESVVLDVRVMPLEVEGGNQGICLTFEDVTSYKQLQNELATFNQELETAYEEVQSTNEELQTTNEELQSTVEELETTNEELQSSNEELETMNEELQSTNEELEAINEELRDRSDALNRSNAFLESILASLQDGVVVLDRELRILAWNKQSEELWGLRGDEVIGRHLMNLDIGLPVERLRGPMRTSLSSGEAETIDLSATNRRGKPLTCRVTFAPLDGADSQLRGLILITECSVAP